MVGLVPRGRFGVDRKPSGSLQTEHGIAIPESFWFSHATASHRAGLHAQAAASAMRYVESTGREGEHYFAALERRGNRCRP